MTALFTNTAHLSTRDLSAMKEGFTLITIGDGTTLADDLRRRHGRPDASRWMGGPRVRDSSFRDDVVFNAERIYIEGEVEAQAHSGDPLIVVQMNTERLHIKSKNINAPLGGLDSGITGDILDLFGITQRMILDGWMITNYGDIMVNIPGAGETYVSPMMTDVLNDSKRLNNFIQGISGHPADQQGRRRHRDHHQELRGTGRADVCVVAKRPGSRFCPARSSNWFRSPAACTPRAKTASIHIEAPGAVYINGEILAGGEWQGGVKVKVAEGADVVITTPHELRIYRRDHLHGRHAARRQGRLELQ